MTVFVDKQHSLLPLATLLSAQALPGAGAFVTGSASIPRGTKLVTFWISYTRGAVGGFPAFRASSRASSSVAWRRMPLVDQSSFVAAAPNASENFYQEELRGPVPSGAAAIGYSLTFEVSANAAQIALEVAEVGVVGTPGTVEVAWTGAG